jgi:hypothetical protein
MSRANAPILRPKKAECVNVAMTKLVGDVAVPFGGAALGEAPSALPNLWTAKRSPIWPLR